MVDTIRLVKYNNKSRKGTYIGVKIGKNREKLYKYTINAPIDLYVDQAKGKKHWVELRKNVKQWHENKDYKKKYIKKIQKTGRLSNQFKKGHTTYETELQKLGRQGEINKLYKQLIGSLVLDKKLLPIILANKTKLRKFFTHTIEVWGKKDGKKYKSIQYLDVGKRLPEEVFNSYYRQLHYNKGTIINKEKVERDIKTLKISKRQVTMEGEVGYGTEGTKIERVRVRTTYQIG